MPAYVASRVSDLLNEEGKALNGAQVLLLGVTYKPDIADERESPAVPVAEALLRKRAEVVYHDPHVPVWTLGDNKLECQPDFEAAVAEADVVVLLQQHSSYDLADLVDKAKVFFDTRGVTGEGAVRM